MTLDACMTSSKFSICVGRWTKILQINYWKTASILEDGKRREQSFEKKMAEFLRFWWRQRLLQTFLPLAYLAFFHAAIEATASKSVKFFCCCFQSVLNLGCVQLELERSDLLMSVLSCSGKLRINSDNNMLLPQLKLCECSQTFRVYHNSITHS